MEVEECVKLIGATDQTGVDVIIDEQKGTIAVSLKSSMVGDDVTEKWFRKTVNIFQRCQLVYHSRFF